MEPFPVHLSHTTDEKKTGLIDDVICMPRRHLSSRSLTEFQSEELFSTSSGREPNCSGKSSASFIMSSQPWSESQSPGFLRLLFSRDRLPLLVRGGEHKNNFLHCVHTHLRAFVVLCFDILDELNVSKCLTFDKEVQLFLRHPRFCLLNFDGHVKGKEQLVSLKQTYELKKKNYKSIQAIKSTNWTYCKLSFTYSTIQCWVFYLCSRSYKHCTSECS